MGGRLTANKKPLLAEIRRNHLRQKLRTLEDRLSESAALHSSGVAAMCQECPRRLSDHIPNLDDFEAALEEPGLRRYRFPWMNFRKRVEVSFNEQKLARVQEAMSEDMEDFAGFRKHHLNEIGRLITQIKELDEVIHGLRDMSRIEKNLCSAPALGEGEAAVGCEGGLGVADSDTYILGSGVNLGLDMPVVLKKPLRSHRLVNSSDA